MISFFGSLTLFSWTIAVINGQGIIRCPNECDHNPCGCCEDNMFDRCSTQCHANGCDECEFGFKQDYGFECELCEDIFGNACSECQDFNGCGNCKSGYNRVQDPSSGLYYCELPSNPAPIATCSKTSSKPVKERGVFEDPSCADCDGEFKCPKYSSKCSSNPCECEELDLTTCSFCSDGAGCGECKSGYFRQSNEHQCVSCKDTFGDSCISCSDKIGCQECESGTYRTYDDKCGLYFCATEEGCGPKPGPQPKQTQQTEEPEETPKPTSLPSSEPTKMPSIPPPPFTEECSGYGDPHLFSWDSVGYHFQGEGYFDYVIPCINSDNYLPFNISAKHVYCGKPYTCIGETIVSIDDGNTISIPSYDIGSGISPVFTDDKTSAIGNYQFIDKSGNNVYYSVNPTLIEFDYIYDSQRAIMSIFYSHDILRIKTTNSMVGSNNICGLCGTLDNNNTNDFTRCDTGEIIDNSGVTNVLVMNGSAYDRTNRFGESCCNNEYDIQFLGISDCKQITPAPTIDNTECWMKAKRYCEETYDKYCYDCYNNTIDNNGGFSNGMNGMNGMGGINGGINGGMNGQIEELNKVDEPKFIDEWMSGCVVDFCSIEKCRDIALNSYRYDYKKAVRHGCVNTVVRECIIEKYMPFYNRFQFC